MPSIVELFRQSCVSAEELARAANVDDNTVRRALQGERINPRTARQIVRALNTLLGTAYQPRDIEGLTIRGVE